MTESIPMQRVFSLSCFEGLRLLLKHEKKQPDLSLSELVSLVEKVEADALSLDLEASAYLSGLIEHDIESDGRTYYQNCIRAVLRQRQPDWANMMKRGRKRFVQTLSVDDRSVFDGAGLMVDPPSRELVSWWDDISGYARLTFNLESMEQAREAELLTIKMEKSRLASIGISKDPVWLGLDDNYAGYDVLTYDKVQTQLVNRLIEVKSTIASPPRFYVTRNEWRKAKSAGEVYSFHVWDMQKNPPKLKVLSVEDVALHIPKDQGNGKWATAEVRVT